MRIYISGPMSHIPNFNSSAFTNAEKKLRDAGHFPINPIAVDAANGDTYESERASGVWISPRRQEYLLRDIAIILSKTDFVDGIYMLEGWEKSPGARIEKAVAEADHKTVYYELSGGRLPAALDTIHGQYQATATVGTWPHQRDRQPAREFLLDRRKIKYVDMKDMFRGTEIETVLQEAQRLVHGPRGVDYGHPLDDFTRTADLLNALGFRRKQGGNHFPGTFNIRPEDIALIMICVKLSRETNAAKRDNLVDICGYAETLHMVHDERRKRETGNSGTLSLGTVGSSPPAGHLGGALAGTTATQANVPSTPTVSPGTAEGSAGMEAS